MRVLFTCQPGEGHLNPLLPIARELKRAGHTVAFATAARFCPHVTAHGFEAIPAGLDWLESDTDIFFPEVSRLTLKELGRWYVTDLFADIAVHRMVPDLRAIAGSWQPDLFVRNDYEFGSCIVSELTGIPQATVGCIFLWSLRQLEMPLAEPLAFARSAFGLSPFPALEMLYPSLYLSYVPPGWHTVSLPVFHSVSPVESQPRQSEALPERMLTMPHRPTVYASLGTVNNRRPELFRAVLDALDQEPINLILTVGRNQDPAQFGAPPPNVYFERFIPQQALLPICDLFITNSSLFTVLGALLNGVPVLMTPLTGDEPSQAARLATLGAGLVLRPVEQQRQWLEADVPEFSAGALREAVRRMLAGAEFSTRARALREELIRQPALSHAVMLLECLAAGRQVKSAGAEVGP